MLSTEVCHELGFAIQTLLKLPQFPRETALASFLWFNFLQLNARLRQVEIDYFQLTCLFDFVLFAQSFIQSTLIKRCSLIVYLILFAKRSQSKKDSASSNNFRKILDSTVFFVMLDVDLLNIPS